MKNADYTHIIELLKGCNLKITQQRLVVYQALAEMGNHPTAEEIFDNVKPNNPTISLATIYKTLDTFTEFGLINQVSSPSGQKRYDAELNQHNHLYIRNTNEIYDFHDTELQEIISAYLNGKQIKNFNIKSFRLHLEGDKIDLNKDVIIK